MSPNATMFIMYLYIPPTCMTVDWQFCALCGCALLALFRLQLSDLLGLARRHVARCGIQHSRTVSHSLCTVNGLSTAQLKHDCSVSNVQTVMIAFFCVGFAFVAHLRQRC